MTIANAFNEIAVAHGGTASTSGTIAGAIDALNDALAGSDQEAAATIEDAVRLLGNHIGGGSTPTGTIEITENGENIDVAQYAYADVNVSGGGSQEYTISCYEYDEDAGTFTPISSCVYKGVFNGEQAAPDEDGGAVSSATAGALLAMPNSYQDPTLIAVTDSLDSDGHMFPYDSYLYAFNMPANDIYVIVAPANK